MSERTAKSVLAAAVVWLVVLCALAVAYKFLVHPYVTGKLRQETGSDSQYRHKVRLALDSFSGYAVLRSGPFAEELKAEGIKLEISDDRADYGARIKALAGGDVDMAAFTIDSLITASVGIKDFPATIVLVIDETRGADAMVARKEAVGSLQDLDSPDARIVLTPGSPSEFLARTVLAHFSLPRLPADSFISADGAGEVYRQFKSDPPKSRRAYVLWEPYVSKAVADGAHVLLDSSRLKGYIVDVLVARRKFLRDNPELVKSVVGAYLRAAYSAARRSGGMVELVTEDSRTAGGERLDRAQAEKLVGGIQWKNTLENYAHFGLATAAESRGAQHMEDMVANITTVLVKTGALKSDPLGGNVSTLFYDAVLKDLKAGGFHPSRRLAVIEGMDPAPGEQEQVRTEVELGQLSEQQWKTLIPVGEIKMEPIAFARGTARVNPQSQRELARLANLLKSFPRYYLTVVGHARAEGDPEANRKLARDRAEATLKCLVAEGLSPNRVRAEADPPSERDGSAQSVSFRVGQLSY